MSVSHEEHIDLLIEALDQNKDSLEVASYLIASISLARHPGKNSVDALEKLADRHEGHGHLGGADAAFSVHADT